MYSLRAIIVIGTIFQSRIKERNLVGNVFIRSCSRDIFEYDWRCCEWKARWKFTSVPRNGPFDAAMTLCNRVFSQQRRKYRSRWKNSLISGPHKRGQKQKRRSILTLMRLAAMLEQGETTALRQRSCTTKLQTVTRSR